MQKHNWKEWVEMLGMLAIVLSLIFLAVQVRQDQILARSELGSGTVELIANLALTTTDPDFALAYAKSLNQPSDLSNSEMVQVNGFLFAARSLMIRECYLEARGVFPECDEVVNGQASLYFGNEYAQSWWRNRQSQSQNPYLPAWVDDKIAQLDPASNRRALEAIKEDL